MNEQRATFNHNFFSQKRQTFFKLRTNRKLSKRQFLKHRYLHVLAKLATAEEGIELWSLSVWVRRLTDELFATFNHNYGLLDKNHLVLRIGGISQNNR